MAVSSPTSSCSSSRSTPFSQPHFASLPVMSMKGKIVEKILENRVTLIVGETGCGKSSQVPQFLLENKMEPILCTQPRRFAVVAVAKMVAKARNCELGQEVGYHIGHSKHLSSRSKIVFKTAGVLLEEIVDKGFNALKYKVIILDEVHERSIESDLLLVCVKQFLLKNNDLRVVLMSATADIARYRDYFKELGRDERVEVLAISSTNQQALFQTEVKYLEEVTDLLGKSSELMNLCCSGSSPSMAATDIKPEMHQLIRDLILHIHGNETDIEKGILVFLPTYHDLLQQWYLLKPLSSSFKIHVLHSSIDIEQALLAMKICKSHRKVILATNIAESSVTIPSIAYVIDSCRSLQVFWDTTRKKDCSELVWVSKSQANQRKGRTGRTCDGKIYRLVRRSFFSKLHDYESPAILKLSLRQQVLMICCAESRAINDPKVLLQKALDPPAPEVIEDALSLLVRMHALDRTSGRGRYEPTFYGRLLASFSLSFDASVLLLKFGNIGLLHEGIILGILMNIQPLPILRPFGDEDLFIRYAYRYFAGDCNNTVELGRTEMVLIGNLCAYKFWQRVFKDKRRVERLKDLLKFEQVKPTTLSLPKIEEEWCAFHNLVHSSLHQVSEIYDDILNTVHRFRPEFLGKCDGLPTYYDPYEFEHTCLLGSQPNGDEETVTHDDEHQQSSSETRRCFSAPFVAPSQFQTIDVAESLSKIIKELRVQIAEEASGDQQNYANGNDYHVNEDICKFFLKGNCNRGSQCSFSHSPQARRIPCRFFFTLQGCRNGQSCQFSHDRDPSKPSVITSPCLPEDDEATAASLLQLFPTSSDECILILDDTDLHFSSNLAGHYDPCKIISTTSISDMQLFDQSLEGVRILWGLHHPFQTIIASTRAIPWSGVQCILWSPDLDSYSENLEKQKVLIQNFFEFLAIRILADALYEVQLVLTMNNIKFSNLQVEKLGRDSFFFLRESFPFDETSFGKLSDTVTVNKPMLASKAISYVFHLIQPVDAQLNEFKATLQKCQLDAEGITHEALKQMCALSI